jgi:hypothetical protein
MSVAKLLIICAALALVGCGEDSGGGGEEAASGGIVTVSGSSTGDETTGGEPLPTDTDSFGSSGDPFAPMFECELIDFVFVVDNSLSMADEQENLVASVPGFVQAIQTALPDVEDIRVGVVDTDTYPGLGNPDPLDACPADADCSSCDYALGALLSKPASAMDPSTSCSFGTEMPYMDGMSDTFATEFECAAIVGTDGNPVEQQASALVQAVSDPLNTADGCNQQFLRDDALLVFLVISDEEDDVEDPPEPQGGSLGEPAAWYEAVLAAKGGEPNNAVALGLLGGSPRFGDCEELSEGLTGAEQTTRLSAFIEMFPTHFAGSVCSPDYAPFFTEALEKIAEGCEQFVPAG